MAKQIAANLEESLCLMAHCKVTGTPVVQQGALYIPLEDPAGQALIIRVVGAAAPGLSGNILTIQTGLTITAHQPEPGERIGGVRY